eukprot:1300603-Rhodomonas_salina.2
MMRLSVTWRGGVSELGGRFDIKDKRPHLRCKLHRKVGLLCLDASESAARGVAQERGTGERHRRESVSRREARCP